MRKWIARAILPILGVLLVTYWVPGTLVLCVLRILSGTKPRVAALDAWAEGRDVWSVFLKTWRQPLLVEADGGH
jgi:hypothetical protein